MHHFKTMLMMQSLLNLVADVVALIHIVRKSPKMSHYFNNNCNFQIPYSFDYNSHSIIIRIRLVFAIFGRSKQERPPRNSEKGAVRCGWASVASKTTTFFRSICPFCYCIIKLIFTTARTAPFLATFLNPSIWDLLRHTFWLLLDSSIEDLLLHHFWLLFYPSIENYRP